MAEPPAKWRQILVWVDFPRKQEFLAADLAPSLRGRLIMRWFIPCLIFMTTIAYIGWQNHLRQRDAAEIAARGEAFAADHPTRESTQVVKSQNDLRPGPLSRAAAVHPLVIGSLLLLISLAALVATSPPEHLDR